jgi:chloride channel protein, CIC family
VKLSDGDEISFLPSPDQTMLIGLASLVGFISALAASTLHTAVRIGCALILAPDRLVELVDVQSESSRQVVELAGRLRLVEPVGGAILAIFVVALGIYRTRRQAPGGARPERGHTRSRAILVGAVLFAGALIYTVLQFLGCVAEVLDTEQRGLVDLFADTAPWKLYAMAAVGGVVVGRIRRSVPPHEPSDVPGIMAAVALRSGALSPRPGSMFALGSALTVTLGGSVGLEGPVVVAGSTSASWLGQRLALSRERLRVLVAAGAASGIAAAFNAPIAGVLFALEIIIGEFALTSFTPVVLASVIGTVMHRALAGDNAVFPNATFELRTGYEIFLYAILGLTSGVVGSLFVRSIEVVRERVHRHLSRVPAPLLPALGLVAVMTLALGTGRFEALGTGYSTLAAFLEGELLGPVVLFIVVTKIVAVSVTLGTGGFGGIFFPSLFVGAGVGTVFGLVAGEVFTGSIAAPPSFALVGMAAVAAAVLHAPLTAAVMIFELCNDYDAILPLMVASILATLVATRALAGGIYQRALRRFGIVLSRGKEQNVLRALRVADAMTTSVRTISDATPLGRMHEIVESSSQTTFPLVDAEGNLSGVLSLSDLRAVLFEHGEIDDLVVAKELGHKTVHVIRPSDHLGTALDRLSGQPFENLVVVDDEDARRVRGLLSHQAVMEAYKKGLARSGIFDQG